MQDGRRDRTRTMRAAAWLAAAWLAGCGAGTGGHDDAASDADPDAVADATADGVDAPADTGAEPPDGEETGCAADGDCDDADPCTVDACDVDFGACVHEAVDGDADGYPAARVSGVECGGSDCDDADPLVHPDADPDCTGADMDCDTLADRDEDADGYMTVQCPGGSDCDDGDATTFPGSLEIDCSAADHDCNDVPDVDNDDDGYERVGCPGGDDCDDADPLVHPGAEEIVCDGKDTDCNGVLSALDEDADQDGWAHAGCAAEGREVDCDDADELSHPGADEICDGVDQDCDGEVLDAPGADDDADTVLDAACGGADCDDENPLAYPGADEVCADGVDQDCDGSADGPVLPASGKQVCDAGRQAFSPSVAFTGSEYAVVFVTFSDYGDQDLHFARLASDGTRMGSDVLVVDNASYVLGAEIRWTGSAFGLAWGDDRAGNYEVYFKLLSTTGGELTADAAISAGGDTAWDPSVAWTGSEFGVAWEDYRTFDSNIFFARVDASGVRVGSEVQITSESHAQVQPSMVWTGSRYHLVWSDSRDLNREIYGAGLLADGTLAGAVGRITDDPAVSSSPDLAWTGSQLAVAWSDSRSGDYDILLALMSPAGLRLGSDVEVTDTAGVTGDPSLAWTGDGFAVACEDDTTGTDRALLAVLDPSGLPAHPITAVSSSPARSHNPFVLWSGSALSVAWQDHRTDPNGVWFVLIDFCE